MRTDSRKNKRRKGF